MTQSPKLTPADDKGLVRYNVLRHELIETYGTSLTSGEVLVYTANEVDVHLAAIESRHAEECKRLQALADSQIAYATRLECELAKFRPVVHAACIWQQMHTSEVQSPDDQTDAEEKLDNAVAGYRYPSPSNEVKP